MNKFRLFLIPFLVLSFALFSCNNDDEGNEPPPLPPGVPTYTTNFKITLSYLYQVTNANNGEVLVDVNYGIGDMSMVAYVIHNKEDGSFNRMALIEPDKLNNLIRDNIATVPVRLEAGEYYVTFVAFKNTKITSYSDVKLFLDPLKVNYTDAIAQVPNDYVHYETAEVKVYPNDEERNQLNMLLQKMTTDLIFEFSDAYKVPSNAGYSLTTGVENVPSAFFIATGKTLTAKEAQDNNVHLYTGQRQVQVPPTKGKEAVVTTFHTLANDNLPEADRGRYWFEFKENFTGGKQLKVASEALYRFTPDYSSSMYMYGLYDEAKPKVKTMKRED